MNFRPADVAKECGVSVNTIRQWCEDYGEFLTPGAQVKDVPRILTEQDLEVLRYVSELRKERLQRPQIVLRLRETKFGTVEPAPPPTAIEPAQPTQPLALHSADALMVVDTLKSIQGRLEALEAQRLRIDAVWLGVACFVAGLIVGLAVWWFQ